MGIPNAMRIVLKTVLKMDSFFYLNLDKKSFYFIYTFKVKTSFFKKWVETIESKYPMTENIKISLDLI